MEFSLVTRKRAGLSGLNIFGGLFHVGSMAAPTKSMGVRFPAFSCYILSTGSHPQYHLMAVEFQQAQLHSRNGREEELGG